MGDLLTNDALDPQAKIPDFKDCAVGLLCQRAICPSWMRCWNVGNIKTVGAKHNVPEETGQIAQTY